MAALHAGIAGGRPVAATLAALAAAAGDDDGDRSAGPAGPAASLVCFGRP
jgi:hypothetical protein